MKLSFEEFKRIYKTDAVILGYEEIDGDMETPISLYEKLCGSEQGYLLESGDTSGKSFSGRYSFIGCNLKKLESYDTKEDLIQMLKDEIEKNKPVNEIKELPFFGGYVGYLGYDMIKCYENIPSNNEDDLNLPIMQMALAENIIVYDHVKLKITIIVRHLTTGNIEQDYKEVDIKIKTIIDKILNTNINAKGNIAGKSDQAISNFTKEEFEDAVMKAKEYIKCGDIFQVVLSQRFSIKTTVKPFDVYRRLRIINPSPYLYYMNFGEAEIVGSSPEMIVKVRDGKVENCPIAGTRPTSMDEEENKRLEKELLEDEKEKAEHLMLVDLGRNDLGKICEFGTVKANNMMHVERFGSVMHMVTNLEGKLRKSSNCFEALKSCIPAGTVSGAPKIRAMEIIDELENKKRGIYAGAIGYVGYDGNIDTCIAIRTIIFKNSTAYLQAGAGIVYDSVPEKEYQETLNKLKSLMKAVIV